MMTTHRLHQLKNKKILFVGIGNLLKKDDGVGVYISNKLNKTQNIHPLSVEVSIENYIGKINRLKLDAVVLIDSMNFNRDVGFWDILPIEKINGFTTNTHNITLDKVAELFRHKTYILGIQPQDVSFGEQMTPAVQKAADSIIYKVHKTLQ